MSGSDAPCAGKTFEHHDRIEFGPENPAVWRCPACETEGSMTDIGERLMLLAYNADMIRSATAQTPVILLPSEFTPMFVGHFRGYELYRVRGIERAMVAIQERER